jgi:hypothetical protein
MIVTYLVFWLAATGSHIKETMTFNNKPDACFWVKEKKAQAFKLTILPNKKWVFEELKCSSNVGDSQTIDI